MINVIRLDSGQSFEVPSSSFIARMEFDLSSGVPFEIDSGNMQANRRGNVLAIKNPIGNVEITINPGNARGEFPAGSQLFVSIHLADAHGTEVRLDLPTFQVGGLRNFPVLGIFTNFDTVRLQAGDANTDSSLDGYSSGVRSALRRSLDRDGVSAPPKTGVTLIADVSASMKFSTSDEIFDLMCAFATGVLSITSQDHSIRLLTSSSSHPMVRLISLDEVRMLRKRAPSIREVGWNVDLKQIVSDDAVVVFSDDLPTGVVGLPNNVHLLSSRKPLVNHGISVTHFDERLVQALKDQDLRLLAGAAREMFDSLIGAIPSNHEHDEIKEGK